MKRMLVDGSNLAHRCRHVHEELHDSSGRYTGTLYGVLSSLFALVRDYGPDDLVVFWEGTGKCWRKNYYQYYKSAREAARTVDDKKAARYAAFIKDELPEVRQALTRLGIPQLSIPHCEADDVLALWNKRFNGGLFEDLIVSTDRDMYQLVDREAGTRVLSPTRDIIVFQDTGGELIEGGEVIAQSPTHYLIMRCLMGDKSDNLPGAPGIGQVKAKTIVDKMPRMMGGGLAEAILKATALSFAPETATFKNIQYFVDYEGGLLMHLSLTSLNVSILLKHLQQDYNLAAHRLPGFITGRYLSRAKEHGLWTEPKMEEDDLSPFCRFFVERDFEEIVQRERRTEFITEFRALKERQIKAAAKFKKEMKAWQLQERDPAQVKT